MGGFVRGGGFRRRIFGARGGSPWESPQLQDDRWAPINFVDVSSHLLKIKWE
jgi:hypothetical protein